MSTSTEKLQDAIGLVDEKYILEAHGEEAAANAEATEAATAAGATEAKTEKPELTVTANPSARKRKNSTRALAIAACLVLVVGVGLFGIFKMTQPALAPEDATVHKTATDDEAAAPSMAYSSTEGAAETGYADGAAAPSRSDALTPGTERNSMEPGEANVLTAGVWNDNDNWPFFTNLVNAGTISFPVFGIDPTHRVKATVVDGAGNTLRNQTVILQDEGGTTLWTAKTDKNGVAYLFYRDGQTPVSVASNGTSQPLSVTEADPDNQQGTPVTRPTDDVTITVGAGSGTSVDDLQVMFIVDTTGSMSDEIAYLQKDFASIAEDVGNSGVSYSVNFYRDEGDDYVTKCNGFTTDIAAVQKALNAEYADGGGDTPEAVADILAETITNNSAWNDSSAKIAFLIFDAPPHDGTDAVLDTAVRSAAERGIQLVPVVASNADRETELFGRALAICTDGTYVFLTDDSGVGNSHLEPIIGDYSVEKLHDVIVRIINDAR